MFRGQSAENRRLRHGGPRGRRTAAAGVRVDQVVPFAGMLVDARPVRQEDGRLGRWLRAVRAGHGPAAVRRRRRERSDGEDRLGVGQPGQPAAVPVREAQVGRVPPALRDGAAVREERGGRRAAVRVPAVQARLRSAQRHGRVRPGQTVFGRQAVAQVVLLRHEKHFVRLQDQTVR